jgi:uncharacterized protein (TIGR02001 family)
MNPRAVIVIAVFLLGASAASEAMAQLSAALRDVTVTASGSAVNHYVFRGLRRNGASLQPAVEANAGAFTVGAWANLPFHDKVRDSADPEIDLYGSYTFALGNGASVVPGFTSYHFPHAPTNRGSYRSTFEPSLAASYTIKGVRLTPKIYYDVVLDGATYELNASYAYPLTQLGTELDFGAALGTYKFTDYVRDASPATKAWGDYWQLGVWLPYQLAHHKITLGFAYAEGRDAFLKQGAQPRVVNPLAAGRGVVSVTYAYTF